jgi:excinuclease ABC subunit B
VEEQDKFRLVSQYQPAGDQPPAIDRITQGIKEGKKFQTILGATGTGKTFVMANIVEKIQKPTLVLVHNKTLAAQLYHEFREFFPDNAVHYFVSYYDYYQPEAYNFKKDQYIAKTATINEEIDRLRNASTMSLLTRKDVLIVSSVSAIYGLGSPEIYKNLSVTLKKGQDVDRSLLLRRFVDLQYKRNDLSLGRGEFSVQGETVTIFPAYEEFNAIRIEFFGNEIDHIFEVDVLTGSFGDELEDIIIFPARQYVAGKDKIGEICEKIRKEMEERHKLFLSEGRLVEAQRIKERTEYDIEMLKEMGFVEGIENYTRYFEELEPGEPASTLIDYFPEDYTCFIDESHITLPQIGGMHGGNLSRKTNLVNYGWRLPSSYDNRPLKFNEFVDRLNQAVFVSATPGPFEAQHSQNVVDLVVRPTGLLDPVIDIKPVDSQVDDLIGEIRNVNKRDERALVTTLTKKTAESLTEYLKELGIRVAYLHSDIETLERSEILNDLRLGKYDVVVGINLLREGLDLPEVSLIGILDADKEGFLRSRTSLIQTIGRAARNVNGRVIMYANRITDSMQAAIDETERRRERQIEYNKEHGITPTQIIKKIHELNESMRGKKSKKSETGAKLTTSRLNKEELKKLIKELEDKMWVASQNFDFETAIDLRDQIEDLQDKLQ